MEKKIPNEKHEKLWIPKVYFKSKNYELLVVVENQTKILLRGVVKTQTTISYEHLRDYKYFPVL